MNGQKNSLHDENKWGNIVNQIYLWFYEVFSKCDECVTQSDIC